MDFKEIVQEWDIHAKYISIERMNNIEFPTFIFDIQSCHIKKATKLYKHVQYTCFHGDIQYNRTALHQQPKMHEINWKNDLD